MAKATTSKTESLTIRVPLDLIAQWRGAAKKSGVSVGALVIDLAQRGMRLSVHPILSPSKPGPLREDVPGYRLTRSTNDPAPVASVVPLTGTDAPARPLGSLLKGQSKGRTKK